MKTLFKIALLALLVVTGASAATSDELFPPNANPGECFTRVFNPPTYETVSERVLVKPATEKVHVTPAKYEWGSERVLTKEASYRLEVVPATYKTVTERILVKPASQQLTAVPATYETVTERVIDKPAHTGWKKGRGSVEKMNDSTGEIMCLVSVPATYKTISKRILKTPATTKTVEIPAEYKTITKKVIDREATTRRVEIPAQYQTVKVRKLVEPASQRTSSTPEEYKTMTKKVKVGEGSMAWAQILCETNATPAMIKPIQKALKRAGYNPGSIDGTLGGQTMRAIKDFQRKHNLAQGGLTMETIKMLDVNV